MLAPAIHGKDPARRRLPGAPPRSTRRPRPRPDRVRYAAPASAGRLPVGGPDDRAVSAKAFGPVQSNVCAGDEVLQIHVVLDRDDAIADSGHREAGRAGCSPTHARRVPVQHGRARSAKFPRSGGRLRAACAGRDRDLRRDRCESRARAQELARAMRSRVPDALRRWFDGCRDRRRRVSRRPALRVVMVTGERRRQSRLTLPPPTRETGCSG